MAPVSAYLRIISVFAGLALALTLVLWAFSVGSRYRLMKIGRETFTVQVANTPELRERGMIDRSSLAADGGLVVLQDPPKLLVFPASKLPFALDLIYVTADGIIVKIDSFAADEERLEGSSSGQPVSGALFVLGGTVDRLRLSLGSWVPVIPVPPQRRQRSETQ